MPITNFARIVSIPELVATCKPIVLRDCIVFTIGSINRLIGGLHGPTHTPAKRMFCAFVRMLGED